MTGPSAPRRIPGPLTEVVIDRRRGVVHAHGELDARAADLLGGAVAGLRGGGHRSVVVDLGGVLHCDQVSLTEVRRLPGTVVVNDHTLMVVGRNRTSAGRP